MARRLKILLRRIEPLLLLVRILRGLPSSWRKEKDKLARDREMDALRWNTAKKIEAYLETAGVNKLQIGTGTNLLEGWLNTDLEPINDGVCYLDVLEPFPFEDGIFDYIFCEHMIEHISYKDGLAMLRECYRVLKPGGRIRVATPDIEQIVGLFSVERDATQREYIEWSGDHLGLYSPELSGMQLARPEWAIEPEHLERFFPNRSEDPICFIVNNFFRSYGHRFLYDRKCLRAALEEVGFLDVIQFEVSVSEFEHLQNIESHHELIGERMNAFESMVMEARRA